MNHKEGVKKANWLAEPKEEREKIKYKQKSGGERTHK